MRILDVVFQMLCSVVPALDSSATLLSQLCVFERNGFPTEGIECKNGKSDRARKTGPVIRSTRARGNLKERKEQPDNS